MEEHMSDEPLWWEEFVTDDDLDPKHMEAMEVAKNTTREEFLVFMRSIADSNPYAAALIKQAEERGEILPE